MPATVAAVSRTSIRLLASNESAVVPSLPRVAVRVSPDRPVTLTISSDPSDLESVAGK